MLPCQILQLLLIMNLNPPNLVPHLGKVALCVRRTIEQHLSMELINSVREKVSTQLIVEGAGEKKNNSVLVSEKGSLVGKFFRFIDDDES